MKTIVNAIVIIFISFMSTGLIAPEQTTQTENKNVKIEAVYTWGGLSYKPVTCIYNHAEQYIRITTINNADITVKVHNGFIRKQEGDFYVVMADTVGKLTLTVYETKNGNQKLLSTNEFKAINLPYYGALIGGKTQGQITVKELTSDSVMHCGAEYLPLLAKYKITSFRISIIQRGKDPILDVPSIGDRIPDKVISCFKNLHAGDKGMFEMIKVNLCEQHIIDGKIVESQKDSGGRNLEPLLFTISDK